MAKTYGEWLKEARSAKGWSQQALADAAFMSRSLIAAIEGGQRNPSENDAKALDAALGTGDVLVTFRPGRQQEETVANYFRHAMALEQRAVEIREYGLAFVPGILQTQAYASALISTGYPRRAEAERHKDVVTRVDRGKVLEDPVTPEVWALLDESVLHRPVGGHSVMADQLDHIAGLVASGRIRAHVVPYSAGSYSLMDGMVSLMWFADQPPVVYAEGMRIGKIHDSPAMVETIRGTYDLALSEAHPLQESLALLRAAAKEHRTHD